MDPDLVAEYCAHTPGSAKAHERALHALPGGQTRSITHYPPYPVAIRSGTGAWLEDVDGRGYLDLVNNYTSLVHGNAYPPAVAAIRERVGVGAVFPSPHELQVELAELLIDRLPSVERVRFTNSGSEAGVLAVQIARRATGRRRVVMFEGGYHGSAPPLVAGETETSVAVYNDAESVAAVMADDVAAIVVEPFLGAGGVHPAAPGFLATVAGIAARYGSLFVLDEVQSLRTARGGAQAALGLSPDLTTLGKIIGGGIPVGAVGGRADIMAVTSADARDPLPHSGTFNGHLGAMAAGHVTLTDLDTAAIDLLNRRGADLAARITSAGTRAGLDLTVTRAGSIMNVHTERIGDVHLALLLDGVYTTPRGMLNLSTVLEGADLELALGAYERAFARIG